MSKYFTNWEIKKVSKILLVDDSSIIFQKTKALLIKENHQVEIVSSGAKAFEKIEETNFDLILLDIEMPETAVPCGEKLPYPF